MKKINMAEPYFTEGEKEIIKKEVSKILDTSLSMGPNVLKFQEEFSKKIKANYSVAMNSCTSALEAAIQFFNVDNEEVIIPCQSFIATAMAVILSGGKPVFAEIEKNTLNLNFEDVRKKINSRTKGVVLVHMAGTISPDIFDLVKLCKDNNLFLIEDAAHTPGAFIDGNHAGTIGDVGCFSFYPSKIITCGEGGMLSTSNERIYKFARSYQNRGRDMEIKEEIYVNKGRNVRMTEMSALLGRIQLNNLENFIAKRKKIASFYIEFLKNNKNLFLVVPSNLENSSFWKFPIILSNHINRDKVILNLNKRGIQADAAYKPPLHLQPVIKNLLNVKKGHLKFSESILEKHLCLPCHQNMTIDDAKYVVKNLSEIINQQ